MTQSAGLRQYNGVYVVIPMYTTTTDTIVAQVTAARQIALTVVTIGATNHEGHRSIRAQASG
jgi:hypothetical protein